jgi:NitT/TauT family transport system substrate-binding protein
MLLFLNKKCTIKITLLISILVIILGLMLETSIAQSQLPVIKIGLSTRFYGPVLPAYIAEELKLYEKYGIKGEVTAYKGGAGAMEALVAGAADIINYFPPGVALAYTQGAKAKIISTGSARPVGWWIMVKKGSPIKTPKDLEGKKIGVTSAGSTTDFFAKWVAHKAGIKAESVPVGGGGLVPHLLQGSLDAIVAFPALSYSLQVSGDGRILVDLGKEMPINLPDVWVASQEIIDKRPDVLRQALKALYASVRYLKEHPDYAVKFIKEFNNYTMEVAKLEYENTIKGLSGDGMLKKEWLQNSIELGKLAGMTALPPIEEIYTDKFVPIKLD